MSSSRYLPRMRRFGTLLLFHVSLSKSGAFVPKVETNKFHRLPSAKSARISPRGHFILSNQSRQSCGTRCRSRSRSSAIALVDGSDADVVAEPENNLKTELALLRQENEILRKTIEELESENRSLDRQHTAQQVIIEQFEGEGKPQYDASGVKIPPWFESSHEVHVDKIEEVEKELSSLDESLSGTEITSDESCEDYDGFTCPVEPDVSFQDALRDRAYWLVGLLTLQSLSGFILARNEELLQAHPVIIYFLTMLVGAGGNAGNQASVRVIRGIALGTLNERTQRQFLNRELKMSIALCSVLSLAGFLRAALFRTPIPETIAITAALALIVFISICLGAVLPLILQRLRVDPAHSSTSIQVIMDILGVLLTVLVSTTILDTPWGQLLVSKLAGS